VITITVVIIMMGSRGGGCTRVLDSLDYGRDVALL